MSRTESAFTLIELLIVLLIIGIAARFVVMKADHFSTKRQVQLKSEHLAHYFSYLQQQAILDAAPIKLILSQHEFHEYHFDAVRKSPWHEVVNSLTREIQFPAKVSLIMTGVKHKPEIIFYPDGEVSPFQLRIDNKPFRPRLAFSSL